MPPRFRPALWAVAAVLAPGAAAAEPAHLFRLPAEPVEAALVRFAVQGGVSVGGFPAPGCAGLSRPVIGMLTPSKALKRLLPSGCGFERIDARAFRITGEPLRPATAPVVAAPAPPPDEPVEVAEL